MDRGALLSAPRAAVATALLLLIPFLWKPFHIDDAFWLAVAARIAEFPLAPYDFAFNWSGTPLPIWRTNLHPPLHGYGLAAIRGLFGSGEFAAHAALLPRALFAAFCAGTVAKRLSKNPAVGLWGIYSLRHAGFFHPFAAGGYAAKPELQLAPKLPVAAAFLGGVLIWPVFCLPLLAWTPRKAAGTAAAAFAGLWLWIGAGGLWAVLAAGGLAALTLAALGARDAGDDFPEVLLAVLWLGGVLVYAVGLNWSINARSLLPAGLPLAVLVLRWTDSLGFERRRSAMTVLTAGTAAAAVFSLWLGAADQGIARAQRAAAQPEGGAGVRFIGHWGFQYYMERAGAAAYDYAKPKLATGDRVVVSVNNSGSAPLPVPVSRVSLTPVPNPWGVATMSPVEGKAGFYSSLYGVTPFALGPGQLYNVIVVERKD